MEIVDLPPDLHAQAVRLWEEAGLTRPWSDAEQGIPKLQLLVRSENAVALAFYARLGYQPGDVVMPGRRPDE